MVTIIVGTSRVTNFLETAANPAGEMVAGQSTSGQVLFFTSSAVQLLGEEIFSVLVFLAFLAFLDRSMSRKMALSLATLGAAVIFAVVHLPTYQWHLPQALIGLVPVRIVLLLPYIMTRNIWVSTGAHVLNDWAYFGLAVLAGSADAGS